MNGILANFDSGVNFWEANPQFTHIGKFSKFYHSDKTAKKQFSSKVMWAIALLLEIEGNRLANFTEEERKDIIKSDFIQDRRFKWEKHQELIDYWKESVMSPIERAVIEQRKKTDERTRFLSSVPYTLENAKDLDALLANTSRFLDILKKLENDLAASRNTGSKKGGKQESLSEQKLM